MLIVDDGSTDDTQSLVEAFDDVRLRFEKISHGGQSRARNKGLDRAKGRWITFLDSDNDVFPQFIERVIATFNAHPEVLAIIPKGRKTYERVERGTVTQSREVPDAFPAFSDNVAKDLFNRKFIFDPTAFIHSVSIRDEGIRFDEQCRFMEDWDYALTIAERHPTAMLYLPEELYAYHQRYGGDGLVSNTSCGSIADAFERIYQKHKNDSLMDGQNWYPQRVEKWRKIQADFEKGLEPPPHKYFFK